MVLKYHEAIALAKNLASPAAVVVKADMYGMYEI